MKVVAPRNVRASSERQTSRPVRLSPVPGGAPVLQRKCACGRHSAVGGECAGCHSDRERTVTRTWAGPAPALGVPPSVNDALSSPGRPLDAETRGNVEARFGRDFSRVRVHTDATAARSAREVNALAYTVGHDVVFGDGMYAPGTSPGLGLLAHELTHVAQQSAVGAAPGLGGPTLGFAPSVDPSLEREADVAAGSIVRRDGPLTVNGVSRLGLARQTSKNQPAAPVGPRVTPEIKQRLLKELETVRMEEPFEKRSGGQVEKVEPKDARIGQHQNRTVAAAAIIKPDGKVTYVSAHFDEGMAEHAEPQLLKKVAPQVVGGDFVAIAIDQVPCPPERKDCQARVKAFREDPEHGSLRVYTSRAIRKDAAPGVTPTTATTGDLTSPKTAMKREPEDRFLFDEKEFTRVRLPIYKEPNAGAAAGGGGVAAPGPTAPKVSAGAGGGALSKGPKAGAAAAGGKDVAAPGPTAPKVGLGEGVGGGPQQTRLGKTVKAVAGELGILLAVLAWGMVISAIDRKLMAMAVKYLFDKAFSALQPTITSRLNQMDHARAKVQTEHPGKPIFANIGLLTTVYLDDGGETISGFAVDLTSVAVSADKLESNKASRVEVGVPYVLMRDQDVIRTTYSVQLAPLTDDELRLVREDEAATEKLQAEKDAPARRSREALEELRRLREKKKTVEPKSVETKPQPGDRSLLPAPDAPAQSFLPGAPSDGPIERAARAVKGAEAWTKKLESQGSTLVGRLGSGNSPSADERKDFLDAEHEWRLAMEVVGDQFKKDSRGEAVQALGKLLDGSGPKLHQMRTQLGGD